MGGGRPVRRRYRRRGHLRGVLIALAIVIAGGCFALRAGGWENTFDILRLPDAVNAPLDRRRASREIDIACAGWYALRFGAFSGAEGAEEAAKKARALGAGGYIYESKGEAHVLAASYLTRAEAMRVLSRMTVAQADILALPGAQLTVRLTGEVSQLDALEEAVGSLSQTAERLYHLSAALSGGETRPGEVVQALLSEGNTAAALAKNLRAAFKNVTDGSVLLVSETLSSLSKLCREAESAMGEGDTALASLLWRCQLNCACGASDFAARLSNR